MTHPTQKALIQMNLQLAVVISDITGVTGLRIVRDIIAGQTDPHALAQVCGICQEWTGSDTAGGGFIGSYQLLNQPHNRKIQPHNLVVGQPTTHNFVLLTRERR